MTPQEVLRAAADLIEKGGKSETTFAKNAAGEPVRVESPDARSFCAIGAIWKAIGVQNIETILMREVLDRLFGRIGCRENVMRWSDSHSQAEVVATLRAAAEAGGR